MQYYLVSDVITADTLDWQVHAFLKSYCQVLTVRHFDFMVIFENGFLLRGWGAIGWFLFQCIDD